MGQYFFAFCVQVRGPMFGMAGCCGQHLFTGSVLRTTSWVLLFLTLELALQPPIRTAYQRLYCPRYF
jgi:hypothetical protein